MNSLIVLQPTVYPHCLVMATLVVPKFETEMFLGTEVPTAVAFCEVFLVLSE